MSARTVPVRLVDVFTTRPFAGNPAGVVLDADGLFPEELRAVAAELGRPATAFLSGRRLCWFTPTGAELTFCGHGTVATVHVLREAGRLTEPRVGFDTAGGPLAASAEGPTVWLEPALRACAPYREPLAPLLEALGLGADDLGRWAVPSLTSEQDVLIPASGLAVLKTLAPDLDRLGRLGRERGHRGVAVTARETIDPAAATHSRFFAPHLGIPEDTTTGSLHASLPVWLWQSGVLHADGDRVAFQAEQGDFLGRPGRLAVELYLTDGKPARVRVGGQAVTVLSGTLHLA